MNKGSKLKNRYAQKSHISERKFRDVLRCFCVDLTALQTAELTGLNRNTINRYYKALRVRITELCEKESPFQGEIEADESYFGARRVRGKRGRGACGKTIVFGLLKRGDKVYTKVVEDVSRSTLIGVIKRKVSPDSIMYTDCFRSYDGLVDWGYRQHYRVCHSDNEFVQFGNSKNHVNGIESFWGFAKNRLVKYQGIPKKDFYYHLKECEFRFNMRGKDMYKFMLQELKNKPLN